MSISSPKLGRQLLLLCLLFFVASTTAFVPPPTTTPKRSSGANSSRLHVLKLPDWLSPPTAENKQPTTTKPAATENGLDEEYPWCFTGRLWFRPALVRVQDSNPQALEDSGIISILNVDGYTLGGTVALEYDTSPVGPYKEYVSMGALVASRRGGGMIGQWGSRLYVSTKVAEEICQQVWAVPAEVADIQFTETSNTNALQVTAAPDPLAEARAKQTIEVAGWSKTRVSDEDSPVRGGLPIWWTPSIKALWVRLLPTFLVPLQQPSDNKADRGLPVHKLRLSASSFSLQFCGQDPSELLGIPLGIGLSVDNVLIEIGRQEGIL